MIARLLNHHTTQRIALDRRAARVQTIAAVAIIAVTIMAAVI